MRYGLSRVFHLGHGFAELNLRTLSSPTTSVGSINSVKRSNHDYLKTHGRASCSSVCFQSNRPFQSSSPSLHLSSTSFLSSSSCLHSPSFPSHSSSSSFPSSPGPSLRISGSLLCRDGIDLPSPAPISSWLSRSISSSSATSSSSSSSLRTRRLLLSLPVRHFSISARLYSSSSSDEGPSLAKKSSTPKDDDSSSTNNDATVVEKKSLVQRFHKAYKNYGKVLIGFHCVTYCVYFTSFLAISYAGLDVLVVLEWLRDHAGLPQAVIQKLTASGAGHFAVAFILCKVISPIRYATTIVGTKYTADYLRRRGYMAPVPVGDRIGDLAKESQKLIETKSAEIKTRFTRSRRRFSKIKEARMKKTKKAVRDLRTRIKRTPKR